MKNRTGIDFSKHEHRVEIFKNGEKEIRIDHFQVGDSNNRYIQFINTDRVLTVTGDYGNWVFCRPFVPSADGCVSDSYWLEKLGTLSKQKAKSYDAEETAKNIKGLIDTGLEEYGYEGEKLEKAKEWYEELLLETDDELEYKYKAYRDNYIPRFIEYEDIPFCEKVDNWLLIIFDAFDEMCNRLKISREHYFKTK
jgi:hypothetical protein